MNVFPSPLVNGAANIPAPLSRPNIARSLLSLQVCERSRSAFTNFFFLFSNRSKILFGRGPRDEEDTGRRNATHSLRAPPLLLLLGRGHRDDGGLLYQDVEPQPEGGLRYNGNRNLL